MKLLVCYDGSASAHLALEKSIVLLGRERPEIILTTVVEKPLDASSHDKEAFDNLRAKREEDLKNAADWVVQQGFDVDAIIAFGDTRKMLVETIRQKKPDIVVVTSRPPVGGVRFGNASASVSDYVIHYATDCPVLVMH